MKGTVKWWNDAKGYGFIVTEKGPDVFVHHASLVMEGFRTLQEGQLVTFEPVEGPKGIQAKNVVPGAVQDPDPEESESSKQSEHSELLALALFGKSIRLVSLTPDGTYRFLDDFAQLHNIYYVCGQETAALKDAVDEFESLVNSTTAKEADFQKFFERNPDFILNDDYKSAHPHIVLERDDGQALIPDFVLEPVSEKSLCDLLELKLPSASVFVLRHGRSRFSAAVLEACAQLREYGAFFEEEANRRRFCETYGGLSAYRPRMFLVIGRRGTLDPLQARRAEDDVPKLSLRTYDDILDRMKNRLRYIQSHGST